MTDIERVLVAKGKRNFVIREVISSIALVALVLAVLFWRTPKTLTDLLSCIAVLPLAAIGGYFQGIWKWQDVTKRMRP